MIIWSKGGLVIRVSWYPSALCEKYEKGCMYEKYEIKFENRFEKKNNFFIKQNIYFHF